MVVACARPWANRATIVRRLLGLESAISIGFCGPTHDKRSDDVGKRVYTEINNGVYPR
jgi:glutathionyl-hydroquinone reductase